MTLQLEVGKKYINRRGEVVEIVHYRGAEYFHPYEDQEANSFTSKGEHFSGKTNQEDLVSEYVEPFTNPAETTTKVPHIHKDLIIAWAQGSKIEYLDEEDGEFYYTDKPNWDADTVYRIKPEKKVVTKRIFTSVDTGYTEGTKPNLELTFEDGKLIKAEVL